MNYTFSVGPTTDHPTNDFIATNAEQIARRFHETYERLDPATKHVRSAVAWGDMREQDRALMIAVVTELLSNDVFIPRPDQGEP